MKRTRLAVVFGSFNNDQKLVRFNRQVQDLAQDTNDIDETINSNTIEALTFLNHIEHENKQETCYDGSNLTFNR
jgi:hypothetical protein